jgi:hypothetical protein
MDDQIEKRAETRRREHAQRKAERAAAKAQKMEARLLNEFADGQKKLDRAGADAMARLDAVKQELQAKINALEAHAAKATPETRERIEKRVAEIRQDAGEREKKLNHAYQLAQEALRI